MQSNLKRGRDILEFDRIRFFKISVLVERPGLVANFKIIYTEKSSSSTSQLRRDQVGGSPRVAAEFTPVALKRDS